MNKYALTGSLAALVLALAPAANAAVFTPLDANFQVSGDPTTGTDPVSASIGNQGLGGTGSDQFIFKIGPAVSGPSIGLGSGSVVSIFTGGILGATYLHFDSVTFNNGVDPLYIVPITASGTLAAGGLGNIPIFSGVLNTLTINYTANGQGSYGGTLNFTPTVPEPTTWAMLLVGFGAIGIAARRRNTRSVRVSFS